MSDPLMNLKDALNKTVFERVEFTEKQKKKTLIQVDPLKQQKLEAMILQTLYDSTKTGFTILKDLKKRIGEEDFQKNEGFVYILLHQLESKRYIQSKWEGNKESRIKYYHIENKGRKRLVEIENEGEKKTSFRLDWEGGLRG
ncbi:helix-turn-helix transcriptional regulator [Alkalihalobacillus hemicellulosilyticus]|uniref:Transcriptional regulator n=1 Tax=Halalkalibacter hemicellulosilyticusJCM 9152 TaxID=1236971 RepID=W4QED5_9BACI|nr:helix-turn-helix transcriptional regulator [Halalkalibacter hemicellulosilyticus]GAE30420.1 transcriptional regulator [Halalkalibacter hemicellulosilyticusJCM 9152]